MPKPTVPLMSLIERRDFVNEKFIEYSALDRIHSNYESLANLALIGGRLDKLIRERASQEVVDARQRARQRGIDAQIRKRQEYEEAQRTAPRKYSLRERLLRYWYDIEEPARGR